ncbi:MAG: hypothetical protein PHP73_05600 [Candidatus Omnitrophica bacterium]|nr:hypothetical protein [Candidatus Omnitrophota bacterium]
MWITNSSGKTMRKSKFSPWIRSVALLVVAVFLPQQVIYAGSITDEITSRLPSVSSLKSSVQSTISTAQSYVSKANSAYTSASNVYNAVKASTGLSVRSFVSPLSSINVQTIKTTAGIATAALTRNPQAGIAIANTNWAKTISNGLPAIKNSIYDKAIWARDQTIFKPGFNDSPEGQEHWKALGTAFIFITGPAGAAEGLLSSAGGLVTVSVARYAPSLAIRGGSWALQGSRLIEWVGPKVGQGSSWVFNSRPVAAYGKYVLVPAGIEVMGNTLYGYSPFKSVAFTTYNSNQGQITNLMGDISRRQHSLEAGSFAAENYEPLISDLSTAFPGNTATPEGVKSYLQKNEGKYRGVISNDAQISSDLAVISNLSNDNKHQAGKFNSFEKGFTALAEVNYAAVNALGNGINSSGIPLAGEFIKSVGSFTPLTGLSIGGSVGADPGQGLYGFANFFASPVENGIGLREGSIIERLSNREFSALLTGADYHSNYRNLGKAAGSAFIMLGGGRQVSGAAKSVKAKAGTLDSFLSVHPDINAVVAHPYFKPAAHALILTLPLVGAALWEGYQNNNLGKPFAATTVMAANMFAPSLVARSRFNSNQQLDPLMSPKNDFPKKSPIPVKSLFEDQVMTLKSMVSSGTNDRLAVIRGLGTGKTTALLAYILPYKIGDNLKRGKGTLILTPNDGVTNDVKAVLRGANDVGFNHQEIQKRLGTNVNFPKEITEKKLKIESVTKTEDKLKQEQDFIDKVMNNDVVVMPYELYSSIYHTYLMRPGRMDAAREKVINRIKDSNFLMDEVDLPAFLPSLMMSEGRMYVPEGNPEYNYWQDVAGKSRQIYDKVKYDKVNSNDMKLDKIEGETSAELEFRTMAQGQKLLSERIPGIEELPLPDSATVRNLVREIKNKHSEIGYTDQEIAEHIAHGTWGYRSYELRNSFTKEEYAVKTEAVPAADIDTYGPKKAVDTVKIGGVEGRDIHNFDLHIPAGQQQILEILHGAKLISRPLKGDHVGNAIDALEILGGSIGFTGTVSDTAKPVLEKAGFTKFDYGQVKASDYEAPVVNADLSQTIKQVTDGIVNNRGDRLDIDITPNNPLSRLIKKVLISKGIAPAKLAKEGENYKFIEGKYVHIGGRTPEKAAQALLDSLKTEKAPYAIVGTANEIGRGLNFDPAPYLAKDGTKVAVNLIEPELMTATQVNQGAGRIGGKFRFTNIKDKEGNLHNPEKIVRLLMSKDMMRPMPEFEEALKLDNSQDGVKSLKIMEALQDVWNKNEREVVARSGLSSERIDNKVVKSEFKEVDMPTTLEEIKEKDAKDYLVLKGYTTESIVKKGEAYIKENKLTIKGLRFMQLLKEAEALLDKQHKILDKITALRILNIDNPVQFAIGLTEKGIVELEDYNKRGLTSVMCLGRVLKPFNTDISSEEIKQYQDIISSALEQKLEFVEGLINKNKIKIDDNGTKELILKKLGLLRGSLANIQEISRQISDGYAKNKGTVLPADKLRLKSAYREFENIMAYQDLEDISAKLGSPAITDLIPLFIPNAGTDEIAKFSAIFDFAKDNNINLAPYNLFELFNLTDGNNKIDFAKFIDKNTGDPYLKIYAQRLALYENVLAKQMQYYIQLFSGKTKDAKEYEQGLQEDVDFLRNFDIDPTRGARLNLAQLRKLSDGKLSDKLLLRIYLGLCVSDEEIENFILDEGINNIVLKKEGSQEVSEALAELIRLGKLYGMERAIREVQAKYAPDVVNGAIKEYLANIGQGKYFRPEYFNTIQGGIIDAVSTLAPLINREGAINAAAVMGIGLLRYPVSASFKAITEAIFNTNSPEQRLRAISDIKATLDILPPTVSTAPALPAVDSKTVEVAETAV